MLLLLSQNPETAAQEQPTSSVALSETGEHVWGNLDEFGRHRVNSLLEDGRFVFGTTSTGLSTVLPQDFVVITESGPVLIQSRTKAIFDHADVADAIVKARTLRIDDAIAASDAITTIKQLGRSISDQLDAFDGQRFIRGKLFSDVVPISEATNIVAPGQQRDVSAVDRIDVADAVFLQHLMREIRATDVQQFRDAVTLQVLTSQLQLFDSIPVWDTANLILFTQALEDFMAGIRTFTCTPGYELQREAITKTNVADFDLPGQFANYNVGDQVPYRFVLNIAALTRIQQESMSAFHFLHKGSRAFYFDGSNAWSHLSTLSLVAEANGSRKDFYLANRNIDPNSITVAVFDGSVHSITTAYSLNAAAGIISFTTAPSSGHDIEASHAHKYKCVFDPDGFKMDEFASGVWRCQLKLREML